MFSKGDVFADLAAALFVAASIALNGVTRGG